jgi:hypothetical protein
MRYASSNADVVRLYRCGVQWGGQVACRIALATVALAVLVAVATRFYRAYGNDNRRAMIREVILVVISGAY